MKVAKPVNTRQQESNVVSIIESYARKEPISVVFSNGVRLDGILGASCSDHSYKEYVDFDLSTYSGKINFSAKSSASPSYYGGLRGLRLAMGNKYPKFSQVLIRKLRSIQPQKDVYFSTEEVLDDREMRILVSGHESIGGPVDFFVVGSMKPDYEYTNGILNVDLSCFSPESFVKKNEISFRIRKRSSRQTFCDGLKPDGDPMIFSGTDRHGKNLYARFVGVKKIPENALRVVWTENDIQEIRR